MRIPGFSKRRTEEPVATEEPVEMVRPLQELLKAENEVQLAQGRIDELNKEFLDWHRHWRVIEDTLGQFVGVLNEHLLSEELTELQLKQQFDEFQARKNVLLIEFHQKLAAWAELKQRQTQAVAQLNPLPMLAPPA